MTQSEEKTTSPSPRDKEEECVVCDFKNAVRYRRADQRCPNCGRQLMMEMVFMAQAGIDYVKITPLKSNHANSKE